jgi:hypothetical protein
MHVVSPTIVLVPNMDDGKTTEMWIGYHIYEGDKIIVSSDLFHMTIPQLRQCGESEIGVMETIMDGADAVYHEMSRRIRKQIESNMRTNAERVAASETLSDQ